MDLINEETKSFLRPFCSTDLLSDPLPIKVYRNSISKDEAVGQAIHWTFEYLSQRNCPPHIMDFILGCVREDFKNKILPKFDLENSEDLVDASVAQDASREPLNLMHTVIRTVDEFLVNIKDVSNDLELKEKYPMAYEKGRKYELPCHSELASHHVSYYSMKNQRRTMEDKLVVFPHIQEVFDLDRYMSYFAVFDGHNGAEAAAYAAAQLHQIMIENIKKGGSVKESLLNAFKETDELFLEKCKSEKIRSGTTAVSVVLDQYKLYVAWVGDSQAALYHADGLAKQLVECHKPDREDEKARIQNMGGEVMEMSGTWRVNGNLAVSRSLGDIDYKDVIISTPEIVELDSTNLQGEYIVLASDGLWDVLNHYEVQQFTDKMILADKGLDAANLLTLEAKRKGSTDNITVIVVFLQSLDRMKYWLRLRYHNDPDMISEDQHHYQEVEDLKLLIQPIDSNHDCEAKANGISSNDLVDFSQPEIAELELKEDAGAFSEPDEEWSFLPPPKLNTENQNQEMNVDDVPVKEEIISAAPDLMQLTNDGVGENFEEEICKQSGENLVHLNPDAVVPLLDIELNQSTTSIVDLDTTEVIMPVLEAVESSDPSILDRAENAILGFCEQVLSPTSPSMDSRTSTSEEQNIETLTKSISPDSNVVQLNAVPLQSCVRKSETNECNLMMMDGSDSTQVEEMNGNTVFQENVIEAKTLPQVQDGQVDTDTKVEITTVEEHLNTIVKGEEEKISIQHISSVTEALPVSCGNQEISNEAKLEATAHKPPIKATSGTRAVKKLDPKASDGTAARTQSPLKGTKAGMIIKNSAVSSATSKRAVPEKPIGVKIKSDSDTKVAAKTNKPIASSTSVKDVKSIKALPPKIPGVSASKVMTKPLGQSVAKASGNALSKPPSRPLATAGVASSISTTKPVLSEMKSSTAATLKSRTQPPAARSAASKMGVTGSTGTDSKIVAKVLAKPVTSTLGGQISNPVANGTSTTTATLTSRSARPATFRPTTTKTGSSSTTITASRPTTAKITKSATRPIPAVKVSTETAKLDVKSTTAKATSKLLSKAAPSKPPIVNATKKTNGTNSIAPKKLVNGLGTKEIATKKEASKNAVERKTVPKKIVDDIVVVEQKNNFDLNSQEKDINNVEVEGNCENTNLKDLLATVEANPLSDLVEAIDVRNIQIKEQGKLLDEQEPIMQTEFAGIPVSIPDNNGLQQEKDFNAVGENGLMS